MVELIGSILQKWRNRRSRSKRELLISLSTIRIVHSQTQKRRHRSALCNAGGHNLSARCLEPRRGMPYPHAFTINMLKGAMSARCLRVAGSLWDRPDGRPRLQVSHRRGQVDQKSWSGARKAGAGRLGRVDENDWKRKIIKEDEGKNRINE